MKALFRTGSLWGLLAGLAWVLANSTSGDATQVLVACGLFLLPTLAVWLTATAAAALPEHWYWRGLFWAGTIAGWLALLVVAQGCAESHPAERQNFLVAFGLAGLAALWLAVAARAIPKRRVLRDVSVGFAVLAVVTGAFAWSYDARTHSLAAQAEARWTEIDLPMAEFEKTLAAGQENDGSQVIRQVFREQVGSRFYKDGTPAAEREPAIERSKATTDLVARAAEIISAKLPPSDDLDLSSQSVAAIEPVAPALETAYRRILAAEPPTWASDPADGYAISVPNFLGIRMFAQLTAAEAIRRLSVGDEEGATRALGAGLRIAKSLRQNPTLVALMIGVAVDGLLASKQVRLPATAGGLESVARDTITLRAELLRRLQIEAWAGLRFADQIASSDDVIRSESNVLPKWARQIVARHCIPRQCAIGALNGAEQVVILKSPTTLSLPDFGLGLQEALSAKRPLGCEINAIRPAMRIHATLLLREQTELIRETRACLSEGRPVESRDSAVLPGVRWELATDVAKQTVTTRLVGAPEWIVKNIVTGDDFWVLPIDGSVAWQFGPRAQTARRF